VTLKTNKIGDLDTELKYQTVLKAVLETRGDLTLSEVQTVIHFNHGGSKDG
jgi:hypothetical protein